MGGGQTEGLAEVTRDPLGDHFPLIRTPPHDEMYPEMVRLIGYPVKFATKRPYVKPPGLAREVGFAKSFLYGSEALRPMFFNMYFVSSKWHDSSVRPQTVEI